MHKQIRPLQFDQISKFSTLIKQSGQNKLSANQAISLDKHIYSDYIHKIKYYARKRQDRINVQSAAKQRQMESAKEQTSLNRQKSQSTIRSIPINPSYYYVKNMEIISMKEFIVLMQESKRKQQKAQRSKQRLIQKQFAVQVGRSIQSSHSARNLRLTTSSANRINKRINQIKNQNVFL